jgi:hypothetical protein
MQLPSFHLRHLPMQHKSDYVHRRDLEPVELPANYGVDVPDEVKAKERWYELDHLIARSCFKDYQIGLLIVLKQEYVNGNHQG